MATKPPAGAKAPQDHQKKAAQADAEGADLVIEHAGREWVIARERADNLEVMEAAEDGQYITAIRTLLGAQQWSEWKDANRTDAGTVPAAIFEEFLDAAMAAMGGKGNSSASSSS